jgi:AraC family transcriptional regulator, transcriptional activator of pobA
MTDLFKIFRLTEEEAAEIAAKPEEPHFHDFEELLVGMEGTLDHFIDFREENFDAPYVSYVTKGKIHRVIPGLKNNKCQVWVIRFRSEFIPETTFQLYANYHDKANIVMQEGEGFRRMPLLCEMMSGEMNRPDPDFGVIRQLLGALFTVIESERKRLHPQDPNIMRTQNITFKNFLIILEENFRRPLGVEFYAEKLFMTSRNLNLICHNILQQSVTEIIETRKLIEAKNLLISTDKTISEISFEIGFNEKSYFTNVFRKRSGQTPSEFRDEMKKLIS